MATNTKNGFRRGSVTGRSQVKNPQNNTWVKRNDTTGQFMGAKQGGPFKGVAKEKDGRKGK